MKHTYDKSKFLEILRENPWVSFAAKKSGISRATIYRWMKDNPEFKRAVELSTNAGVSQLGEIAEMGLVKHIKEGNLNAIKYYLAHNIQRYVPKRSEYVFPPNHLHYGDSERCESCGRLSATREAEKRELRQKINKGIENFLGPDPKESKEKIQNLLNKIVEDGRKRDKKEREGKEIEGII